MRQFAAQHTNFRVAAGDLSQHAGYDAYAIPGIAVGAVGYLVRGSSEQICRAISRESGQGGHLIVGQAYGLGLSQMLSLSRMR